MGPNPVRRGNEDPDMHRGLATGGPREGAVSARPGGRSQEEPPCPRLDLRLLPPRSTEKDGHRGRGGTAAKSGETPLLGEKGLSVWCLFRKGHDSPCRPVLQTKGPSERATGHNPNYTRIMRLSRYLQGMGHICTHSAVSSEKPSIYIHYRHPGLDRTQM